MASTSLFSVLPPEIICRVFESADDFSVVASLAQTARVFYHSWRENMTYICKAVAPRTIWNLTDAERLLEILEESQAVSHSQESPEQVSINRVKRLLFITRCASAASDSWESLCKDHGYFDRGEDPHMTPSELARFEHAFYCVWTIGVLGTSPHLQDKRRAFLDDCSPRELCRLDELGTWATYFNENAFGSLGLVFQDEVWKAGCDLVSRRWVAYQDGGHAIAAPDYTPLNFFAFFDNTQRYLDLIEDK